MKHLVFSPAAATDLENIWDYTADTWGLDQADKYVDDIQSACVALADGSKVGRNTKARDGYWHYHVGRHLVFYKMTASDMIVIRILHQRMDVERHL